MPGMLRTYNLTVTKGQAQILKDALDLYSRVGMGQMEEMLFVAVRSVRSFKIDVVKYIKAQEDLKRVRTTLMGRPHTYKPILSYDVDDRFRVAYDLLQVIRHRLAWDQNPEGGITVNFDQPWKTSSEEPLATIAKGEEKYILTVTGNQADVLGWALDLFMRAGIGQIEAALYVADATFLNLSTERRDEALELMEDVHQALTGSRSGGPSISNPDVNDDFRVACDLRDVIQHRLAWDRNPEGDSLVIFRTPFHWGKNEPLAMFEEKA